MNSSHGYDDPDCKYTDRATGVLKNILGITDKAGLQLFESYETAKNMELLIKQSPKIASMKDILKIHKLLFGTTYEWAGQLREVEISKQGNQFLPTSKFQQGIQHINSLLSKYKEIGKGDRAKISEALAQVLDALNHMHPFREGNGRTQRTTAYLLAKEKGYALDMNPLTEKGIYDSYMEGTIEGNKKQLTELISNCLKPITARQKRKGPN